MEEVGTGAEALERHFAALERDGSMNLRERRALASLQAAICGEGPAPIRLSRYVVHAEIGAGGAGVVYRAHDPELDRPVAIKLLHERSSNGLGGRMGRLRLLREAQALARLSHPNIVAVFDVGTYRPDELDLGEGASPCTAHGGVFIVMELVDGVGLDRWLTRQRSLPEILRVFIDAGRGLAAAHAVGLTHRDFKPSNVVVANDGRARVLDFGLAIPLEARAATSDDVAPAADMRVTAVGDVLGTPAYMSPEQRRGATVGAASDQYSFCLALYEAVYGRRPFAGRTAEDLGERPAVAAVSASSRLDAALRRGLALRPEDRWPSMHALLARLERGAGGRRRWSVAGGVAASVAVASIAWTGAVATAPCSDREGLRGTWDDDARDRVRDALAASADDTADRVTAVLDRYGEDWVVMRHEACEATRVHDRQSGHVLDLRMACLERRREELGAVVEVLADADAVVVAHALEAATELPSLATCAEPQRLLARVPPPADRETAAAVDAVEAMLASVPAMHRAGRYALALELAQQCVEAARELDYAPVLAEALLRSGSLRTRLGQHAAARPELTEAFERAVASGSDEIAFEAAVRAVQLIGADGPDSDEADARRWAAHAEALHARAGLGPRERARLLRAVGYTRLDAGDLDGARGAYELALQLVTDDGAPMERGEAHNGLGRVSFAEADYEGAALHFERALELGRTAFGSHHPAVAQALNNVALIEITRHRYPEARTHLERALAIAQRVYGADHEHTAIAWANLGTLALREGRTEEALARAEEALRTFERALGPEHYRLGLAHENVAAALLRLGDLDAASRHAERAVALLERRGHTHPDVSGALVLLGKVRRRSGQAQDARALMRRAFAIAEAGIAGAHPSVADALVGIGECELDLGNAHAAVDPLERAIAIFGDTPSEPELAADAHFALARALVATHGDRGRATALAVRAQAAYARAGGGFAEAERRVRDWLSEHPM